jgi:hypothetical protein
MAAVKGAELLDLQPGRMLFFVLGCGIVLPLALGALKLNNLAGHLITSKNPG